MKLLHYITRNYALVTLLALALSGAILYFTLKQLIVEEMIEQLDLQAEMIASELRSGREVNFPLTSYYKVDNMTSSKWVRDTLIYDPLQQVKEDYLALSITKKVNDSFFRIEVMTTFIGWKKYYSAIFYLFLLAAAIMATAGIIFNYFLSRRIWQPFFQNLRALQKYSLNDPALKLDNSSIAEFKEMQAALEAMTKRSKREYLALREFTENASHEIQTPLSISRAKLERMAQMPVTPEMADCIVQCRKGLDRLSRLSKDLLLLAKLENETFTENKKLSLRDALSENCTQIEELFSAKEIHFSRSFDHNLQVSCNEELLNIFLSNLLSNALNHTPLGGNVQVSTTSAGCLICNSGTPLTFPPQQLFDRFKKGEQFSPSNGLGLSIVKQIGKLYGWEVKYAYESNLHLFEAVFL